ncbi:Gfo/Idh/MocA family protein [Schlesneria paludicola]|uniref:Gfo/Idh/MocA family protein n=1 Tax=Schlesneria paludicola TaxID=360056 RepID=UPI0012FA4FFF|nr:Gfo/Idh/MocA family oxidoreductase [Schlesneria paludicola]
MGDKRVKVGVVGLGRFGRLHALTLAGLAETELVAVVARRQTSLDAIRSELPEVPGWLDLGRAIKESAADAWVVACSTDDHVRVTKTLLQAGKCVLLEKPVSVDLSEAESLAPLVRSDSSNLMLGHILLFNSEFRQLREEVAQRGRPILIDCVRHRPASIVRDFPGENPLHAAMVHDLYAAQVLMKREEPQRFSARLHRTESGEVDLAIAQVEWSGGTIGTFAASYLTPTGMPPRGFDRTEVFGQGWVVRVSPNPRPIEVWDDRARWPMALEIRTDASGATGMMAEELRCFSRVVRGLETVPVGATYSDALQTQRWMNQLQAAAVD